MLEISGLSVFYGRIRALHEVSMRVDKGQIVSLIGANGAGKSTLMWTLMAVLKPRSGKITFMGEPLPNTPDRVFRSGIALVPERRRLFANLSVKENLLMGAYLRNPDELGPEMEFVFRLFPVLKGRLTQYAGTLSGGEQQMLAIARALIAKPRLILLDEPSLGLAPNLSAQVFQAIEQIRDNGTTVLLAEQNAFKALEMADMAYVLETGRVVMSGPGPSLLEDPVVQEAYLGVKGA